MSEFDEALEFEQVRSRFLPEKGNIGCYDTLMLYEINDYTEDSFIKGARWAREFTVDEICEWIVCNGEFIVRNHCPSNLKRAIESHFKDRGGEK